MGGSGASSAEDEMCARPGPARPGQDALKELLMQNPS
jgi:hypothetical protein